MKKPNKTSLILNLTIKGWKPMASLHRMYHVQAKLIGAKLPKPKKKDELSPSKLIAAIQCCTVWYYTPRALYRLL